MLQSRLARFRKAKLSTYVIGLFAFALVLPWIAFGWLTFTERAEQIGKTEAHLAALAAAYGEHAATIMRQGIEVPAGDALSDAAVTGATERGAEEMAAFQRALNVPGVRFALHRIEQTPGSAGPDLTPATADKDGLIAAEVDRPAAGIATTASMSEDLALQEWRARNTLEAAGLFLRMIVAAGVGVFLVQQLRWRERLQTELAIAREAAEVSSRAKSEFLANMSHELRTPLNAIIGFSEIIKAGMQGPLNARYREYGGDIFSSGTHLLGLINDILDLSKLEAGHFELYEEDLDLADVIQTGMHLIEAQAQKTKVTLSKNVPDGLPLIRADNRRMRQIVINLLSNAVKFTPEGGRVQVSAARTKSGLAIEISDTGIGMAPEQLAKALEPFGQVESKLSRKYEGTGLGLPLAKQLIELHGGTLAIESAVDSGTIVTVVLPPSRILAEPPRLSVA